MENIKYGPPPSIESISPVYVKTQSYSVGDHCSYKDRIYECIVETSGEVFNPTHWKEITVNDYIKQVDESSIKTINNEGPDSAGNINVTKVDYADNLTSEDAQSSVGEFIYRTSGGDASIADGDAWAVKISGNSVHSDYVPENIELSVVKTSSINVSIDRDTFVSEIDESGTYDFTASGSWDAVLSEYGISVSGAPKDGSEITVEYAKEDLTTTVVAPVSEITASVDRNTFVTAVGTSGTIGFQCVGTWGSNFSDIGVTVTGSPVAGNTLVATHGYTAPEITPTVSGSFTIEIDEETYATVAGISGTTVFTYTDDWDIDPEYYGITITGTPENGDTITVVFVAAVHTTSVTVSSGLTAEITNLAAFVANVPNNESVTYIYATSWDRSLSTYGVTVTGTPVDGDRIIVSYTKESINVSTNGKTTLNVTLNATTFKSKVDASGTYKFTYTTEWSDDLSDYGLTVTGDPIAGDKITVTYTKEERGTIIIADPATFKSTGWNLYNHSVGYARVLKYSDSYGFGVGGTYTALEFSETLSGTKTTITPVDGFFDISKDGYVWVTGGNSTDTYIYMTWSDWTEAPQGDFETYTETSIDLTTVMENFPNGLMNVGEIRDEIDLNLGSATSKIEQIEYTDANLALVKATGRSYDYDDDYIYVVRASFVTYPISVSGAYKVSDHGMEFFTGTEVATGLSTLYGQNLKDKLRTDVVTISSQSLTSTQKNQVRNNIGAIGTINGTAADSSGNYTIPTDTTITQNSTNYITSGAMYSEISAINQRIGNVEAPASVFQDIQFSLATSAWSSSSPYVVYVTSAILTSTCGIWVFYDSSYSSLPGSITAELYNDSGTYKVKFTASVKPTSALSGYIRVVDSITGIVPVERGGTGANSAAGARTSLGAAADSAVVHNTGNETIEGQKIFSNPNMVLKSSDGYPTLQMRNNSGNNAGSFQVDIGDATNQTKNQIRFVEYSPNTTPDTGNTGKYEGYRLPVPKAGKTGNSNYDILTSKNPVTVAQGGTGATTAADARTNLGLTVANNLTTTSSGSVLDARQGKTLSDRMTTYEEKKITRIGTYFTEKDSFKARRTGNVVNIFGYIQITTQVPANTEFGDLGFPSANGVYLMTQGDGTQARVLLCFSGKLKTDSALPTGYYYIVGGGATVV